MSIEQKSKTIRFFAFFTESKEGKTGLTVTIDVYNPSGTKIVNGGSVSETGGGLYYYDLSSSSTTTSGGFVAIFKTATTSVDQKHIPALWVIGTDWVERIDQKVSEVATTLKIVTKSGQKLCGIPG
jgi:hypothetical protein